MKQASKLVGGIVLDTLRSHPLLVMLAIVMLVVMPGVVRLASMLPHAN